MTTRDRTILIALAVLAAVVGSWLLVIAPQRNQASKLGGQISTAQAQLVSARAQVAAGEAARTTFATSYTSMARLGEAVPSDDNVPSLIVQVQAAANSTRTEFQSLTLNPGSGGAATTAASASAAQAVTGALPPGATVGAAGLPIEPFTFTFNGSFFHLSDFLGRLEHFVTTTNQRISVRGRLMTLNAISLGAGPNGFPQITATVSATTYIVPASQGVLAGATQAGPPAAQPVSTNSPATPAPTGTASR